MPPKGRGRGRGAGRQEQEQHPPGQGPRQGPPRQGPPGFDARGGPPGFDPRQGQGPARQDAPRQEQQRPQMRGPDDQQRQAPGRPEQTRPPPDTRPPPREEPPPAREVRTERRVDPEQLGIDLEYKMQIQSSLPRKPKPSQRPPGRVIRLISNCFSIDLPQGSVYHYDVDIVSKRRAAEPKKVAQIPALQDDKKYRCMSTKRNREIIDLMLRVDPHFRNLHAAYDGRKNLYTKRPLNIPNPPLKCNVQMPPENPADERTDDFVVNIQPVRKKDSTSCAISLDSLQALFEGHISSIDQEAVMAVETILRHRPCQRFFPVGRSFFYPPAEQDIHPLGGGREIWFGYHQSLRLGQWKPMVNLDITATTFYQKGPVLNYIAEFLRTNIAGLENTTLRDADIRRISKELKNMRIEVNHLTYKRKYRILTLTRERADRLEFNITENGVNRRETVANYFRRQYNRQLRFPHLPCLQVNPAAKQIYLPIEVCDMVEGQHCKKKLEERQNAEMIKFTARPPKARFDEIRDLLKRADYSRDQYLQEFGMRVYNEPLRLEGRVLGPPSVRYNESKIVPNDGSWDMRGKQFFKGAEIDSWVFLSFGGPRFCTHEHLNKFAKLLVNIAGESGISIGRPQLVDIIDNRRVSVKAVLTEMKKKYNAQLAVIAVPGANKAIYGEIKQAAETVLGLTTQCVKDDNVVKKCNPPLVSNLCQKINAKMGGINNSLTPGETPEILRRPVLIIGADVTHPSPSKDIKPSIAAAVGSLDSHPSRYAVTVRAQTNVDEKKQAIEIILELKSMVKDLLSAFYKNTRGKKPEKIIFYRDGVSEGQFEHVMRHEVTAIREACQEIQAGYEPGITFVVVQKRHHTRFMPQDARDGVGRMKNIPPGTTVDNTVVHPLNFDFFLCSHFGLQGTSRPCHYTVLADDNNFSADDLHKLTYYLCHTYVRCTKSISSPAPVMYAHLAAFRTRQYLVSMLDESSGDSTDSASTFHPLPDAVINAIKVIDTLKNTMYFV
ncbi:protein argonaute-4 isoform X1 [Parasteatoda tepidariorum]|uniref:protein argonaute-4 isoform X1 n=1 Tax=Parasteatoda tepidariorum TaxID=114398 RepID=UPI001C72777F|nr:protein argonaute-4 isoform X1 [Parasteatoda tepidariorum]XP_042908322.1 protein argonaute-4 isoform X1 [Parasteatoda tepidariorum]